MFTENLWREILFSLSILDVNEDSYHFSYTFYIHMIWSHGSSVLCECCSKTSWFVFQACCAPMWSFCACVRDQHTGLSPRWCVAYIVHYPWRGHISCDQYCRVLWGVLAKCIAVDTCAEFICLADLYARSVFETVHQCTSTSYPQVKSQTISWAWETALTAIFIFIHSFTLTV